MEFLRSVLAQDESVTVSTRVTYDLPVNPLSHILMTLKCANDTGTLTNYSTIAALLAQITSISVEFKGSALLSLSFKDLAILSQLLTGRPLGQTNLVSVNNDVRAVTVPIPFGRRLYNPKECFPAVRRGDLRLVIDYAAAQTGIDTLIAQIETVELLGAEPDRFIKATTISKTLTSGIGNDIDLPIGNPIIGCLLFGTTTPTGAVYTATIDKVKVLVDNMESHYSEANWETIHNEFMARYPQGIQNALHLHALGGTGAASDPTFGVENDSDIAEGYAYLNFDPADDDFYLLDTVGKSRVHLRLTAGASDAARVIPVELIETGALKP